MVGRIVSTHGGRPYPYFPGQEPVAVPFTERDVDPLVIGAAQTGQPVPILSSWSETGHGVGWSAGSKRAETRDSVVRWFAADTLFQNPDPAYAALCAAQFENGDKRTVGETIGLFAALNDYLKAPVPNPRAGVTLARIDDRQQRPTFLVTLRSGVADHKYPPAALTLQALPSRYKSGPARLRAVAFLGNAAALTALKDEAATLFADASALQRLRDDGLSGKPWQMTDYAGAPGTVERTLLTNRLQNTPDEAVRVRSWALPALRPAPRARLERR